MIPLESASPAENTVASAVDRRRVVHVDDPRGHERETLRLIKARQQLAQPVRRCRGVVVEECDIPAVRLLDACIVSTGKPTVRRQRDKAHPGVRLAHEFCTAIGRPVVHQDRLELDPLLALDRRETSLEVLPTVPGDDDDGDLGLHDSAQIEAWKNKKHVAQWKATLKTYVSPVFGSLPVQAVDVALVMKVPEPIWTTKPETAARVRGSI